ncbi:hypothetical protein J6S55_01060 [Candidatus Saccharibacteria bacterium]|nr:hypothetical protein [Candidatus Saccharibacteria bacterium]
MSGSSNLEAIIDRDLGRLSSEYYSILDLAREYDAPILAVADRQDLRYIKNKLSELIVQIEYLPNGDHKEKVQHEAATVLESVSHSLLHCNN